MALGTFVRLKGNPSQLIAAFLRGSGDNATRTTTNGSWLLDLYPRAIFPTTNAQSAALMPDSDARGADQPIPTRTDPAGTVAHPSYQPTAATSMIYATDALARLEAAAQADDVTTFLDVYYTTRWDDQPAEVLVRVIRLALHAGVHVAARELSKLALQNYPNDLDVQRLASIFFSNKPGRRSPPSPEIVENIRWIGAHGSEYSGKWVALCRGVLLGAAESLAQLIEITGDVKGTDIMVTVVH